MEIESILWDLQEKSDFHEVSSECSLSIAGGNTLIFI